MKTLNGRKTDMETESLRVWKADKKEVKKLKDDNGFKVNYKGMEITLGGFTQCFDKTTDKMMFAYKFKNEEKLILFYVTDENVNDEKVKMAIEFLTKIGGGFSGYAVQDMRGNLENIYQQKGTWDKLGENSK